MVVVIFMEFSSLAAPILLLAFTLPVWTENDGDIGFPRLCSFPAIFNFGDSNSDTSSFVFPDRRLFRWASNGRLIIDFMAEELRLPYLKPYNQSLSTDFSAGFTNFAAGGASIMPGGGYSPSNLGLQVSQFLEFKALFNISHNLDRGKEGRSLTGFPTQEDFSKALYTVDIGQNDLAHRFEYTPAKVLDSITGIVNRLHKAIEKLHKHGARTFWIHNTGPAGCLPQVLQYYLPNELDEHGCARIRNLAAQEFNRQLMISVNQLREKHLDSAFVYVDLFSAKRDLIINATELGFVGVEKICCGVRPLDCRRQIVNGTVHENGCDDPQMHITWDGLHYTEAANRWIAKKIITGSYSEGHIPLEEACQRH